jgi:hypothetical protein
MVRTLDPDVILPTHGAPLTGRCRKLCDHLIGIRAMEPFQFPDDAGFRAMLAQMKGQDEAVAAA